MPTGKELVLGTLFKGKIDQSFTQAVTRLETALKGVNGALGKFGKAADTTKRKVRELGTQINKTAEAPKKLNTATEQMNKQISKATGGYQRFMGALKVTASYSIAAGAMYAVVNALRAGVGEIVDYDQALKNLQAITGATSTQVDSMGDVILDVAKTTKFSTTEIAEGMVLLGQSGFSAEESMQAIRATADLASGTLSNMGTVTDLLTTTIRAFGLEASESTRVADVMGNAVNKSKLTVDKLRIAFGFVGAAASQAQLSLEETSASMAVLANNGLRASTIGTGLRQVLAKMIAPSEKLRETMEKYGIEVDKINPTIVGFKAALQNLSKVLVNSETGMVDMGKAFDIFKLRGAQAAAIITRAYNSGEWDQAMDNAMRVGTAAEMAQIQLKGLAAQFKNLRDRAGVLAVSIGDAGVEGALQGIVAVLREVVKALDIFANSALGGVIVKAALAATAIIGLALAFKGLKIVLAAINFGKFITSPLGLAIAAISLSIGVLQQWAGAAERAREAQRKIATELGSVATQMHTYQQNLKALHESQKDTAPKEYAQELKRLINDFPELTKNVNVAEVSFEELNEEMEKIKSTSADKKLLELADNSKKVAEAIEKENIQQEIRIDALQSYSFGLLNSFKFYQQWVEGIRAGGETQQEATELVDDMIESLKKEVEQKRMSTAEAKQWAIENIVANKAVANALDVDVLPAFFRHLKALDAISKKIAETPKETAKVVDETRQIYIQMFDTLDALSQADASSAIKATERKVAAFKDYANKAKISEIDRADAVKQIWDREMWNFQLNLAERKKGEKLTAAEILEIWNDFVKTYQVVGEFRVDTEKEILADIRIENEKHATKLATAAEKLSRELLQEQQRYQAERLRQQQAAGDLVIQRKILEYKRLNKLDEIAVAEGRKTQEKADEQKKARERAFLKFIMKMRMDALNFSIKTYGKDSKEYIDALGRKEKAESDYQNAVHDLTLDNLEKRGVAEEGANAKSVSDFKDSMGQVRSTYEKTASWVKRGPIVVGADITPAQAALNQLLKEYQTKIASWMAIYAEQVSNGFSSIGNILAKNYAGHIEKLRNQMNRIKTIFDTSPVLNPRDEGGFPIGANVDGLSDAPSDVTGGVNGGIESAAPTTVAPRPRFDGSGLGIIPGAPGTIQWNFTTPSGGQSLEVNNQAGQGANSIEELGNELDKMGLSHG